MVPEEELGASPQGEASGVTPQLEIAWARVVARAFEDPALRQHLEHDPAGVLQAMGVEVPSGVNVATDLRPTLAAAVAAIDQEHARFAAAAAAAPPLAAYPPIVYAYPPSSYPSAPYPSAPYPSAPYPSAPPVQAAAYPSAPYPSAPPVQAAAYPSAQPMHAAAYPSAPPVQAAAYPSAQPMHAAAYPSAPPIQAVAYPSHYVPAVYASMRYLPAAPYPSAPPTTPGQGGSAEPAPPQWFGGPPSGGPPGTP